MSEFKGHDYLDITTPQMKSSGRMSAHLIGTLVVLAASLASVGGIYYTMSSTFEHHSSSAQVVDGLAVLDDDLTKRQLTAFIERFLPAYYNYSYTLYDQNVVKVEAMMTPAFQAAYNQRSEDLELKRKLNTLRVNTDGIKILSGSWAFSSVGDRYYVRLSGTMTFTTGINGASGDFPLTLLIAVQKNGQGFLVDNVERLR